MGMGATSWWDGVGMGMAAMRTGWDGERNVGMGWG